jgi:hypothetical protein
VANEIGAGKGIGVPAALGITAGLGLLAAAIFGGKPKPKAPGMSGPKLRKSGKGCDCGR